MVGYIIAAAAASLVGYSIFVERKALRVTNLELAFSRLPKAFDGFTILQLSDLHASHWWDLEQRMEAAVRDTAGYADLLVLTGDIAVNKRGGRLVREFLHRVRPGRETFAVYGNTEHKVGFVRRRRDDLRWEGLRVLTNEHVVIERGAERIVLAGVDDPYSRRDELSRALEGAPQDAFKLLIAHAPDIAGDAAEAGVDLVICGHTHGGQVRFPVVGAVYSHLRRYPKLVQGLYEGEELTRILRRDAGKMRVYVSRGIGISNLPLRFLCPPEVVFFTLRSQS